MGRNKNKELSAALFKKLATRVTVYKHEEMAGTIWHVLTYSP